MTLENDFTETLRQHPRIFFEDILGTKLWRKQIEVVNSVRDNKLTAVRSGHGVGKMLCVDTLVPTPDGDRTMGSLKPGDRVFGLDGRDCKVTAVTEVTTPEECYRLTFCDGTTIDACGDHEWLVETQAGNVPPRVLTTRLMLREEPRSLNVPAAAKGHLPPRRILSIERIEPKPMRCIAVDHPSRCFLVTDAYIPTHNSFIAAGIPLWFCLTHEDATVLTTASTYDQVVDVVWRQMRKLHESARWPLGGKFKPQAPQFEALDGYMRGFSPGNPGSVNGRHSKNVLVIFDEAQEILDNASWDAFDSLMSAEGAKWLAIGNPLYAMGPFYQCFRSPSWNSIHMSCLEHPNVVERREVIPGAVGYDYVENVLRADPMKGPGTLYWETRVLGNFPSLGADSLMSEKVLETCWTTALGPNRPLIRGKYIGLDPSEMGSDPTVAVVLEDGVILKFYRRRQSTARETVNWVLTIAQGHGVPYEHINYDSCGPVGSNLTRAFEVAGVRAHPIHNGKPPVGDWNALYSGRDAKGHKAHEISFLNRRAELHWTARLLFEAQRLAITPEAYEAFRSEATQIRYGFFDDGRMYIEKKLRFRDRVGRSPDHADAVFLALARDQALTVDMSIGGASAADDPDKYSPAR